MKKLEKDLQEAYKLRFEKWHKKYSHHPLYLLVIESFQYPFSEIGVQMPKLIEEFNK